MYILLDPQPNDGYLRLFPYILAILHNVAMNTKVRVSFRVFSFSLYKHPEVELLDNMVVLFLIF